jgi:hypothetical protein
MMSALWLGAMLAVGPVHGSESEGPGAHSEQPETTPEAALAQLEDAWQDFRTVRFTGDQEHDAPMVIVRKPQELRELDELAQNLTERFGLFEVHSAALYIRAAATRDYSSMLTQTPPPDLWRLESGWQPQPWFDDHGEQNTTGALRDRAKALAAECLALAETHGRWSTWQDRAWTLLNELDPTMWPYIETERPLDWTPQGGVQALPGPLPIETED